MKKLRISPRFSLIFPCYFAFFVSGAMVLTVGTILPFIIAEMQISYSVAGGLLSAFAIGNLLASFVFPVLATNIGRKAAIVSSSFLIPLSWILIAMMPPVAVMYAAFVIMGIGRGSISIINNAVINDNYDGKPTALNLLHMTFAMGALFAPVMTNIYVYRGWGWRAIAYTMVVATTLVFMFYSFMKIDYNFPKESPKKNDVAFYKMPVFYVMGILLFLYLGLENCVNGWFVTYFQNMRIMSGTYATNLVSVTWLMVMLGRLMTAKLSTFIDKNKLIFAYCIATAIFFILMISTTNIVVITVSIAGLGFFFAGIYPTSVASAGLAIKGSTTGMAAFLAIAAIGGIVTPEIVGLAADANGLTAAVMLLSVNVIGMLVLSFVNIRLGGKAK
jgi:fucose permease